jgi:hypothetical protein
MIKEEAIRQFAMERPESRSVFGYGSGVFKQASSTKPLTDVIFVVDDLKDWHMRNMRINPDDYSFIGRLYINGSSVERIKGVNGVTYFSEINGGEFTFKYGVIELHDFMTGLDTWNNLFMAGRFHKPVLHIKSETQVRDVIFNNRKYALIIACLFCDRLVSKSDIYKTLCGLSYIGDARMSIAENPHKVQDIVEGSFDKIEEIYPLNESYITHLETDLFYINHEMLLRKVSELPSELLNYLYELGTDFSDLDMLRINIHEYISNRNRVESRAQIIHGVMTNGVIRSIPYAMAKVKKRFSK